MTGSQVSKSKICSEYKKQQEAVKMNFVAFQEYFWIYYSIKFYNNYVDNWMLSEKQYYDGQEFLDSNIQGRI